MKLLINKPATISRIEFWASSTIYVFAVFFLISRAVNTDADDIWTANRSQLEEAHVSFDFYQYYFFPQLVRYTTLYLAFLLLNFQALPGMIARTAVFRGVFFTVVAFLFIGLSFGITDTYLRNYLFTRFDDEQDTYNFIFQNSFIYSAWMMLMFGFYSLIKYAGEYLLANSESIEAKYKMVTRDGLYAFILWMISVFLLLVANAAREVIAIWVLVVPFAIFIYWYSFYSFIPASLNKKRPFVTYILKVLLVLLISFLPVFLILLLALSDGGEVAATICFNLSFQLLITVPLSWVIYKRQLKGREELYSLKTALGRSNANFDFLRSQINPHFLFNALNTIYGTALQEKAERTSEGIERLGDMMRFMLQENMQEKITLNREIDYLNNYISLQRLRTDTSPDVRIVAEIDEVVNCLQIAPMLLIPFVENAFKHGISLREPSYIKISLQIRENTVYFDVNNSIHNRADSDPEKNRSGIGMDNVKQRLLLLYPGRHELIVRETGREFFIHLTIELPAKQML